MHSFPARITATLCPHCNGELEVISDALMEAPLPTDLRGLVCVCAHCSTAVQFDHAGKLFVADITRMPIIVMMKILATQQAIRRARHARN